MIDFDWTWSWNSYFAGWTLAFFGLGLGALLIWFCFNDE
jgi:hypothetical protein